MVGGVGFRSRATALLVLAAVAASCSSSEPDVSQPSFETPIEADDTTSPGEAGSDTVVVDPDAPDTSAVVDATGDLSFEFRHVPLTAGGWVTGLAVHPLDPDRRYVRTDVGGAYRWDGAADRWVQMLDVEAVPAEGRSVSDYRVESIATARSDADVVYLSVGDDGPGGDPGGRVLASTDGGRTWTSGPQRFVISGNGTHRQRTERLAIDPVDPSTVLLGTRAEGIWRSVDGAASFDQVWAPAGPPVDDGGEPAGVAFVIADPTGSATDDGRAATWFAGVESVGVLRSDDGGASWEIVREVASSTIPLGGTVAGGDLYVAYESSDPDEAGVERFDGARWTRLDTGLEGERWAIAVDTSAGDAMSRRIVAAAETLGNGTVAVSDDGGDTWRTATVTTDAAGFGWIDVVGGPSGMEIGGLEFGADGRLWFAAGLGVWRAAATGGALDWIFDSRGIEQLVVTDVVAPGDGSVVVAVADWQGFRVDDLDTVPDRPLVDDRFAGGTDLDASGRVPGAMVWAAAEYHLSPEFREGRGARSGDGGATWSEMADVPADFFGGNVAMSATDPDRVVWVPSGTDPNDLRPGPGPVMVTDDGGASWRPASTVDESGATVEPGGLHRLVWWFQRVAVAADRIAPDTFHLLDDEERFFTSVDGGTTFVQRPHAPPCRVDVACHVFGAVRADPLRQGTVWVSTGGAGLHRTVDGGATPWQEVGDFDRIGSLGFGAPATAGGPPTLFADGTIDGVSGVWRSIDDGASFSLVADFPGGSYDSITVVAGDPVDPTVVYVGFAGTGVMVGRGAP